MIQSLNLSKPLVNGLWALTALALAFVIVLFPPQLAAACIGAISVGVLLLLSPLTAFALLLALAPLRTLVATESAFNLPLDLGQITFILLVGIWCTGVAVNHQRIRIRWTPLYLALGGFLAATGLSVINAASVGSWLTEWLKWVVMAGLVFLVVSLFMGKQWQWLMAILIAATTAHAIVGLYTFLGGSGALHLVINGRFFRAFGTFGQPNPFGGFMGLIAPVALMMALARLQNLFEAYRKERSFNLLEIVLLGFYSVCGLLLTAGLFASWSRGAWLGFIASLAMMAFALPRKIHHSLLISLVLLIFGGGLWFSGQLPASITQRIQSATQELFVLSDVRGVDITPENYPIVERLGHWQASMNMARANPWLGVGFGNFDAVYHDYRLINWDISLGHAHNYYLNVMAETGIIGLAAYAVLFLTIFWMTWRTRRHPDRTTRYATIGLLGTWTYLAIHSLTDNLYVNNIFIHLGVLLGLLALFHLQLSGRAKAIIR